MLDPIPRPDAGLVERREREGEGDARDAVDGDRPPGGVRGADPIHEPAERGEEVVLHDELDRPEVQGRRRGVGGETRTTGDLDGAGEVGASRVGEELPVGCVLGGRGVGDRGDAAGGEPLTDRREVRRLARPAPTEPVVGSEDAARGPVVLVTLDAGMPGGLGPDGVERPAVQQPHRPGAVLDSDRPPGHEAVEGVTVEVAGDRLVVVDAPEPLPGWSGGIGGGERHPDCVTGADGGRSERHRTGPGGHRRQVEVVVMEAWEQGTAAAVDHAGARRWW